LDVWCGLSVVLVFPTSERVHSSTCCQRWVRRRVVVALGFPSSIDRFEESSFSLVPPRRPKTPMLPTFLTLQCKPTSRLPNPASQRLTPLFPRPLSPQRPGRSADTRPRRPLRLALRPLQTRLQDCRSPNVHRHRRINSRSFHRRRVG
jgi:hypothetical protein